MNEYPRYRPRSGLLRAHFAQPRPVDIQTAQQIQKLTLDLHALPDAQLAQRILELRERVQGGASILNLDVVRTSFSLTHEAVRRVLGLTYFTEQLLAGLALSSGAIVEMKTGEGKTLVAALPAALRALESRGVHVATVNRYLAARDFEQLSPVYQLLGLTCGLLPEGVSAEQKRPSYRCDITYGTGYEYGFDFLRDQTTLRQQPKLRLGDHFLSRLRGQELSEPVTIQRELYFCILDEVDSVLLDEANTPLIISASSAAPARQIEVYRRAREVAAQLREGTHFILKPRERSVSFTNAGQAELHGHSVAAPRKDLVRPWMTYVEQALRAQYLLKRDVDYIVRDGKVLLVDQYTGRIFNDRTWQEGLHQAVECKEDVTITGEKQALARISRQRFYGLYKQLCGMTGTATGHEQEFLSLYRLPTVVIPERLPNQRQTWPTRYFASAGHKWEAIAESIAQLHALGRPVLVGTRTIEDSEALARVLHRLGIPHRVLNGKQDQDEAELVAQAGQLGAVTIATNMAGRGTDIRLGPGVAERGGLHVIAAERQESLRVDRQLFGRAARQGDPGTCQGFVSAEDSLIRTYGPQWGEIIRRSCGPRGEATRSFDRVLDQLQSCAERARWEQRSDLIRHDHWLDKILTSAAERNQLFRRADPLQEHAS